MDQTLRFDLDNNLLIDHNLSAHLCIAMINSKIVPMICVLFAIGHISTCYMMMILLILSSHSLPSYVLQGGPRVAMPTDARHSCPWPQVSTVCEIPWPSSGSSKIKPCQPCKIISAICSPVMEFSSCSNSIH